MHYEFKTSFDRRFKKLSSTRQKKVFQAIDALMKYIDGETEPASGLGLKNCHADYWEIRAGIKDRILFEFTDHITFLFIGSHEEVNKFMRRK